MIVRVKQFVYKCEKVEVCFKHLKKISNTKIKGQVYISVNIILNNYLLRFVNRNVHKCNFWVHYNNKKSTVRKKKNSELETIPMYNKQTTSRDDLLLLITMTCFSACFQK